jgi:hypothetical protein
MRHSDDVLTRTPTTVGVIYRCKVKGCRFARKQDVAAVSELVKRTCYYGNGAVGWQKDSHEFTRVVVPFQAIGNARPACPDHGDRLVRGARVDGTYNAEKKCNAACRNARRADCECSCAGANHGDGWR